MHNIICILDTVPICIYKDMVNIMQSASFNNYLPASSDVMNIDIFMTGQSEERRGFLIENCFNPIQNVPNIHCPSTVLGYLTSSFGW